MTAVSKALRALLHRAAVGLSALPFALACAPTATPVAPGKLAVPKGAVEAARTPFYGVGATGRLDRAELIAQLQNAALVCLGEQHDNLTHHALQLQLVELLQNAALKRGASFALGMEMFQLPAQAALNAYAHSQIDEETLLLRSEYAARWGYDFEFYRPILDHVRERGGTLLALNAPREWTKAVARNGVAALSEHPSSPKPSELNVDDSEHRAFFLEAMSGHGHGHRALHSANELGDDPFYAAQVLWDEVMATTAAAWLAEAPTGSQLVVLAGAGHCHRSAVPRRFQRRLPQRSVQGIRLLEQSASPHKQVPANSAFDMLVIAVQP